MIKGFKYLTRVLVFILFSGLVSSCEEEETPDMNSKIVGSWYISEVSVYEYKDGYKTGSVTNMLWNEAYFLDRLDFYSDGRGVFMSYNVSDLSLSGYITSINWGTDDQKIIIVNDYNQGITFSSQFAFREWYYFKVENGSLILRYTCKRPGSDNSCIYLTEYTLLPWSFIT